MTKSANKTECAHCGVLLADAHIGACPTCGKTGRRVSVGIAEEINLAEHLTWEKRKEFYEKNPVFIGVSIVITLGAPFLGLVLLGWLGVTVGLLLAVASIWLGPLAVIKVRETEHGG